MAVCPRHRPKCAACSVSLDVTVTRSPSASGTAVPFFRASPCRAELGLRGGTVHTFLHMGFRLRKNCRQQDALWRDGAGRSEDGAAFLVCWPFRLSSGRGRGEANVRLPFRLQRGSGSGHSGWTDVVMSRPVRQRRWWLPDSRTAPAGCLHTAL